MRGLLLALALLACACSNDHPPPHAHASVNATATAPAPPTPAAPAANEVQPPLPRNQPANPALTDLSPAQRRAYELGYRDCSEGRYAPANHLEAYRIGCAAAHNP